MRTRRFVIALAISLCGAAVHPPAAIAGNQAEFSYGHESGPQGCLPGIETAVRRNQVYKHLYSVLASHQSRLKNLLAAVVDQGTYTALLTHAASVASKVEDGRVVVTLPDGTVVVDTASSANSYANFIAKTVNENHNSRVAVFATQLYPCGIGLERKLSTSTGEIESYLALRLGKHLDSVGTARLSTTQTEAR
jgi:hypothetical protein